MLRACLLLLILTWPILGVMAEDAGRLVRAGEARSPEEERQGFHVPEGFSVQLFADETMLGGKPINMAFDARGRLWVSSTREYPYAVPKNRWSDPQGTRAKDSKDTIRILEDTDGDGRADKVTIFADELNIPTGVLPYKNGCIAFSIPNLWFLDDTDNDGKCDTRKILFGPLGWEKDTHGMVSSLRLGLDGWVYATHGFSNTSHFEVRPENRKPDSGPSKFIIQNSSLDLTSGSVFRFQPDGSAVELWTRGQVNPFGLCWDSWGNLYSADCHSNPITQLIRGAEYPQFGSKPGPLGFGPVMCRHAHGSTGLCGIIYLDGGVWGPEWDDHMLVGNCVTSRINHDRITFTGSTPKANEAPDFLTSDDPWFRPVDLQLGPDSTLYIADFYNRIIGHYEVPLNHPGRDRERGRIWRVVREGFTSRLTECDFAGQSDEDLVKSVGTHFNITCRRLAYTELQRRGISRMPDRPEHAVHRGEGESRPSMAHAEGIMHRSIVSVLMEPPHTDSIDQLLRMLAKAPAEDTHLRHAARIALSKALSFPGGYAELPRGGDLSPLLGEVILISTAVPTADAAFWLLKQIGDMEKAKSLSPTTVTAAITHIARHLPTEREGELVTLAQKHFREDLDAQLDLLAALREGRPSQSFSPSLAAWSADVTAKLLKALQQPPTDPKRRDQRLRRLAQFSGRGDAAARKLLASLPDKASLTPDTRAALADFLAARAANPALTSLAGLVRDNTVARPVFAILEKPDQAAEGLRQAFRTLPQGLQVKLAGALAGSRTGVTLLLDQASPTVLAEPLVAAKVKALGDASLSECHAKLTAALPPPDAKLKTLIRQRLNAFSATKADAKRGEEVFTAACSVCHRIGVRGNLVGPQLDGIGQRGAERLLEDIMDPNRAVDPAFRLHVVKRSDGSLLTGLLRQETTDALVFVDAAGQETRLARSDVAADDVSPFSLMPAGLGEALTEAQLHDLLAFLLGK